MPSDPHVHYCYDCAAPWTHVDPACPPRDWGTRSYLCAACDALQWDQEE